MPGTTLARGRGLVDEQRAGKGGEETGSSHTEPLQAGVLAETHLANSTKLGLDPGGRQGL